MPYIKKVPFNTKIQLLEDKRQPDSAKNLPEIFRPSQNTTKRTAFQIFLGKVNRICNGPPLGFNRLSSAATCKAVHLNCSVNDVSADGGFYV